MSSDEKHGVNHHRAPIGVLPVPSRPQSRGLLGFRCKYRVGQSSLKQKEQKCPPVSKSLLPSWAHVSGYLRRFLQVPGEGLKSACVLSPVAGIATFPTPATSSTILWCTSYGFLRQVSAGLYATDGKLPRAPPRICQTAFPAETFPSRPSPRHPSSSWRSYTPPPTAPPYFLCPVWLLCAYFLGCFLVEGVYDFFAPSCLSIMCVRFGVCHVHVRVHGHVIE